MIFKRPSRQITRLLVVEDEPLVAFDNEYILEQEGYEVLDTVNTADQAIDALRKHAPHAVLLDVNLAGAKSGIAVAEVAHSLGIAVIFLSGNVPADAARMAHAAVGKPYAHTDLIGALAAVDTLLQGKQLASPPPPTVQLFV